MRRGGNWRMDVICRTKDRLSRPAAIENLVVLECPAREESTMTPLEKIRAMKMPFAELKGVTFVEADKDRVVEAMTVRPDLCTANNTIHGGAVMAVADSVGAAASVVNRPA